VSRTETASPAVRYLQRYVCGPAPPTPELADVSTHRYSLCVSGTLSLAWYSTKNSQQDLSPENSKAIIRCYEIRQQYALRATAWQMSRVTSHQVKASHRWWLCNTLYHAEISPEQGASKIVKNVSTDGEVMLKIKVACFFLGHGVVYSVRKHYL